MARNVWRCVATSLADYQPTSSDLEPDRSASWRWRRCLYTPATVIHARIKDLLRPKSICKSADYSVLRRCSSGAWATWPSGMANLPGAASTLLKTLAFAQAHQDRFLEAGASLNLGFAALQTDRYDEAVDWSRPRTGQAMELGSEDTAQLLPAISDGPITSWEMTNGRWNCFLKRRSAPQGLEISATNSNGSVMPEMSIMIRAIRPMPHSPIARRSIWQGRSIARKT